MSRKHIYKASGEEEPFQEDKLLRSLIRSGVPKSLRSPLIKRIRKMVRRGMSTGEIYRMVLTQLRREDRCSAARYRLRRSLMDLGPSGYPFEKFVAALLDTEGYRAKTGVTLMGKCVTHEVDVVALKDHHRVFVECKYRNKLNEKTDIKVALYIYARSLDLQNKSGKSRFDEFWLATNTKFTRDAIDYGECVGLKLLGWDYPAGKSLKDWIDRAGLYPITCLSTLKRYHKKKLLAENVVLCHQILDHLKRLSQLGLSDREIGKVLDEVKGLMPA